MNGTSMAAQPVKITVDVPADLFRKIEAEAAEREIPINKLVTDLMAGWFKAHHPR